MSAALDHGDHDAHELDRIRRFLERSGPRFGMAIAICADMVLAKRYREQLVAQTTAPIATVEFRHEDARSDLVARIVAAATDAAAVFVVGLDRLVTDSLGNTRETSAVANLNQRRDELPGLVPARVVFWVSKAGHSSLLEVAWDLCQVMLTTAEFEAVGEREIEPRAADEVPEWMMLASESEAPGIESQLESLARIHATTRNPNSRADAAASAAELAIRLGRARDGADWLERAAAAAVEADDPRQAAAHYRRLGQLWIFLGELDIAADYVEHATRLAESPQQQALADRVRAELSMRRLDYDDAVELLRDRCLPAFQASGDLRAEIDVWGLIAEIHELRGDLDQAIELRKSKQLALQRQLEDEPGQARTQQKIAAALLRKGLHHEAREVLESQSDVTTDDGSSREQAPEQSRAAEESLDNKQHAETASRRSEALERARRRMRQFLVLVLLMLGAIVVFVYLRILRAQALAEDNARLADERQQALDERERAHQESLECYRLDELGRRASQMASSSERGLAALEAGIRAVGAAPNQAEGPRTVGLVDALSSARWLARLNHGSYTPALAVNRDGTRVAIGGKQAKLWDAITATLIADLTGHESYVETILFSPDGTLVATVCGDHRIRLWSAEDGTLVRSIDEPGAIAGAFSPNGELFAAGTWDREEDGRDISIWKIANGSLVSRIKVAARVEHLSFSPDARLLLADLQDLAPTLFDPHTGVAAVEAKLPASTWTSELSHDGLRAVSGSYDGKAWLWDPRDGSLIATLEGHRDFVRCAFAPAGDLVATASLSDDVTRLWSASDGALVRMLSGYSGYTPAFSPDGNEIVTASAESILQIWTVRDGGRFAQIAGHVGPGFRWKIEYATNGRLYTANGGDDLLQIWSGANAPVVSIFRGHDHVTRQVIFSRHGSQVVSDDGTTTYLWSVDPDGSTGKPIGRDPGEHFHLLSPLADLLVTKDYSAESDDSLRMWRIPTGISGSIIRANSIYGYDFSPDGRQVAVNLEGKLHLWHADGEIYSLQADYKSPTAVAFSPDAVSIAMGERDGGLHLWTLSDTTHRWKNQGPAHEEAITDGFEGHADRIGALAFAPDSATLVSLDDSDRLILWHTKDGSRARELQPCTDRLESVTFASAGDRIVAGGGGLCIWNAADGSLLVHNKDTAALHIAVSPSGDRIATADPDNAIRLWRASDGELIAILRGHTQLVTTLAFSPDGTMLASGSHDTTVRIWAVTTEAWLERACAVLASAPGAQPADAETRAICQRRGIELRN